MTYLLNRVLNTALYRVIILPCLFPCGAKARLAGQAMADPQDPFGLHKSGLAHVTVTDIHPKGAHHRGIGRAI